MKKVLLALLLTVPVLLGQCGKEFKQGNLTIFCAVVPFSELARWMPLPPSIPDAIQVFIKTEETTTRAFRVAIRYQVGTEILSQVVLVPRWDGSDPTSAVAVFYVGKVQLLSVLVEEFRSSALEEFNINESRP
jgi:hypothetical protein